MTLAKPSDGSSRHVEILGQGTRSAWLANAHLLHAAAFQALGDEAGEAMSLDLADAILDRIPNPGALRARSEHLRQHLHGAARHLTEFGEELSGREIAVLRLAADGLTQREIADQLFISYNTVKTHLKATYRKLGRDLPRRGGAPARGARRCCRRRRGRSKVHPGDRRGQVVDSRQESATLHECPASVARSSSRVSSASVSREPSRVSPSPMPPVRRGSAESLTDQAELQGVLSQVFDLGLEIVSISTHPGEFPEG